MRRALAATVASLVEGEVRSAGDFQSALQIAEAEDLGLCVVDLHMPGATPFDGLSRLKAAASNARFVVVTGSELDDDMLRCLRLGVEGFVSKSAEVGVMEAAIRLVLAGGRYVPPRLAEMIEAPQHAGAPAPQPAVGEAPFGNISPRQLRVLEFVAQGRSNKEIAHVLQISPATVKSHVAFLIAALGAVNRTEAANRARETGLI